MDNNTKSSVDLLAICMLVIPQLENTRGDDALSVDIKIAALKAEVGLRALEIELRKNLLPVAL